MKEKYKASKGGVVEVSYNGHIYKISSTPESQGTFQRKKGKELHKKQRFIEFSVRPCLLVITETTPL